MHLYVVIRGSIWVSGLCRGYIGTYKDLYGLGCKCKIW